MRTIKVTAEHTEFLVRRDDNGNLSCQMEGADGWSSTPLHATIGEMVNSPMAVAERVSTWLDQAGGTEREEVLSAVLV